MAKIGSSNDAYEEFEPYCEWKRLDDSDVLEIHLTGFKKEDLRVRIKNNSELTVSGERVAAKDEKKIQFKREIKLPKDINTDQIRAKFGGSVLAITMPKKASAAIAKPKPAAKAEADAGGGGDADGEATATAGNVYAKPKKIISGLKSSLSRLKLSKETAVAAAVAGVILVVGVYYLIKN